MASSASHYSVCVVGLGKVGLPLAAQYAASGATVIGADINQDVVDVVNSGDYPVSNEPYLDIKLHDAFLAGRISATTATTRAVQNADVVVVVVPLLVDEHKTPDFAALDSAVVAIGAGLRPQTLVCFETTLPVGTTRERFTPALEAATGLQAGTDFFVCFSPERVNTGRTFADLRRYPKLVGGVNEESGRRAVAFYEEVLQFDDRPDLERSNGVWLMANAEAAEFTKLAETTYRDVNIALANEFAMYAGSIGVDFYQVIEAANSQPFSHLHRPGVAVGGHCIPVYPELYLSTDPMARLPRVARDVNLEMPRYAVNKLQDLLGDLNGQRVVILGLAYRGQVKEKAFSGAPHLADLLVRAGAIPLLHDPLYTDEEIVAAGFSPFHYGEQCDAAILHTDHIEYSNLDPESLPGIRAFFDGRRMLPPALVDAALPIVAIGLSNVKAG